MLKVHVQLVTSALCAASLLIALSGGTQASPQRSSTKTRKGGQAAATPRTGGPRAVPAARRVPAAPARRTGVKGQLDAAIAKFEQDGDFDAARGSFQRIVKLSPRWGAPRYNLALLADWQESWADATALYRQFLAIEPVSDSALRAQLRLDWIARRDATPAQSPEQARLLYELRLTRAITLTENGRLDRAAAEAAKAIDADPAKWEAHALLATIQAEMGEFQGARTSCGAALKLAPEAYRASIDAIEKRVSAEEAARELRKSSETALARKEYGAAAADLARAWEKVPDRVEIGIAAAEAWALSGEYEKAVELLGRLAPHAAPALAGRVRSLRERLEPAATASALARAPMTAESVPSLESAEDETKERLQAAENASTAELNAAVATARKRDGIRREYEYEIEQNRRSAQFMDDSAEDFDRTAERADAEASRAASMGTAAGAILAGGQAAIAVASRDRARDSRQKAANLRNRADALQRELEAGLPGVGVVAPVAIVPDSSASRAEAAAVQPAPVPPSPVGRGAAQPATARPTGDTVVDLGGGVRIEMVFLPDGSFDMGSNNGESNERPAHRVTLSKPYLIGKYEVTQGQWKAVMGANPSKFTGNDDLPVERVSWDDCQEFIRRLNEKTGMQFRLPTEAEWEYACRAGTTGDWAGNLDSMGWFYENAGRSRLSDSSWNRDTYVSNGNQTHPVGRKQPNLWGIYDMHGNVYEWCQDPYDENYYRRSTGTDPSGRVLRGGSWVNVAAGCRSAVRGATGTGARDSSIGFRLARSS